MDPAIWGPAAWHMLHRLAYKFESREDALSFYASLQSVLPCPTCRDNLKQHMVALPFPKRVREVSRWVYDVHHRVNVATKATAYEPSFASVHKEYQHVSWDDSEWIFVSAVIEAHPGKFKASNEYKSELRTFLTFWTKYSDPVDMPSDPADVATKSKLRTWMMQYFHVKKTQACAQTCTTKCMLPSQKR